MTLNNFLSYLQQILSMVDPGNRKSVALAKSALTATMALAYDSGKVGSETARAMCIAEQQFDYLILHAKEFAGKPGEAEENYRRRNRLKLTLIPSC